MVRPRQEIFGLWTAWHAAQEPSGACSSGTTCGNDFGFEMFAEWQLMHVVRGFGLTGF
jgi:hypothetical protein